MNVKKIVASSLTALLLISLSFVAVADNTPTDSVSLKKKRQSIQPEKDSLIFLEITPSYKSLISSRYELFSSSFDDWQPDSLHWLKPSTMNMNSDGSWFLYAKYLANNRRTGGIIDSGNTVSFSVVVTYWNGAPSGDKCTGTVIHSNRYYLKSLRYRKDAYDVSARGTDSAIPGLLSRVRCVMVSREIG